MVRGTSSNTSTRSSSPTNGVMSVFHSVSLLRLWGRREKHEREDKYFTHTWTPLFISLNFPFFKPFPRGLWDYNSTNIRGTLGAAVRLEYTLRLLLYGARKDWQTYPSRSRNTAQQSWLRPLTLRALSRLSNTVCPERTFTCFRTQCITFSMSFMKTLSNSGYPMAKWCQCVCISYIYIIFFLHECHTPYLFEY